MEKKSLQKEHNGQVVKIVALKGGGRWFESLLSQYFFEFESVGCDAFCTFRAFLSF